MKWIDFGGGAGGDAVPSCEVPAGEVDGVNRVFQLSAAPLAGVVGVYLNGLRLLPTTHYTLDETAITLDEPPPSGASILTEYWRA